MGEICKAFLSGNLTKDAEIRQTADGFTVVRFSVAVNKRKKKGGEWANVPNYFDCVIFGNYGAAISESLTKGAKVILECEPDYSVWEKNGEKRAKVEFIVSTVVMPKREPQPDLYAEELPF